METLSAGAALADASAEGRALGATSGAAMGGSSISEVGSVGAGDAAVHADAQTRIDEAVPRAVTDLSFQPSTRRTNRNRRVLGVLAAVIRALTDVPVARTSAT